MTPGARNDRESNAPPIGLTAFSDQLEAATVHHREKRSDHPVRPEGMRGDRTEREIGFRVLTGQGAVIDTTSAAGKLVFGIFAALADDAERELISELTRAGLAAARARGRKGGRKPKMTPTKVRLAAAAMGKKGAVVGDLREELGITSAAIFSYVSPTGEPRRDGKRVVGV